MKTSSQVKEIRATAKALNLKLWSRYGFWYDQDGHAYGHTEQALVALRAHDKDTVDNIVS